MADIQAVLIANSVLANGITTGDDFMKAQKEMNKPMVLFFEEGTREPVKYFFIVAEDLKDLTFMFNNKIFYTSSIPVGEVERYHGAIFYGVDPDLYIKRERTATTGALESVTA
jgi:hypothetical protein